MSKTIGRLADELLEAIALEDMKSFQKNGFYTTFTKAGDCKVLVFEIPNEQKKLEDFNLWRDENEFKRISNEY